MNRKLKQAYANIKKRKCTDCKEWFMPANPDQVICTPTCYIIVGIEKARQEKSDRMTQTNKERNDSKKTKKT